VPASPLPVSRDKTPFDVVFRSAKPTLDAILQLQPALKWLERHRPGCPIDSEFLKVIPTEQELLHRKRLFRQAEQEPAPEGWSGIAVAMMVDSMPAAHRVNDAYVCGIVDSMYGDPVVWEGCSPGFSAAVIARSVREARRLDSLPTPGAFLDMCARHRRLFEQYRSDVVGLWVVRDDAIHGPCPF
jgi:hypothetical protein